MRKPRKSVIVIKTAAKGTKGKAMRARYTGTQRLICLFISLILIFAVMHRDEIPVDSSFACSDFGRVSLQKAGADRAVFIFRDDRTACQLENLNIFRSAGRSLAGLRPGQWATLFLIPILLLLKLLIRERFLPLCQACENQYGRRTLDYIHHKDGKKA